MALDASSALAREPEAAPSRLPRFERLPVGSELSDLFPAQAASVRNTGFTRVRCMVAADGQLQQCRVVEERPAAIGFGEAALRATAYFSVRAGTLVGEFVHVSTTWRAPERNPAAPPVDRTEVNWERQPTQGELLAVLREHAPSFFSLAARLRCEVTEAGTLEHCGIVALEPADPRVEDAVTAMIPLFRFRPPTEDGQPVRDVVTIPVRVASGESVNADGSRVRRR